MTDPAFPRPARRFEGVGFSEIVRVRNRVMELLAEGRKVWRFEGGEPWMNTPDAVKAAMGDALVRNQTRYAPSPLPRFFTCLPSEDTYARHP